MSTFQFDTDGGVPTGARFIFWSDLNDFQRGYFTAIAREAWETLSQVEKDRLDHFGPISFSDFAPESLGRALRDCAAYEDGARTVGLWSDNADTGGHFWRVRQSGYLTDFPPLRLVIAEDGLLHSEERTQ